jgi:protein-S-isoprenylcysteine O-methyltransferase Ste14
VRAALLALSFPVVELVLGPWALTGFHVGDDLPRFLVVPGVVLLVLALLVLADAHLRLIFEGKGTPSPLAPPVRLVRSGVYRFARHPMYVATTVALVGEALVLSRAVLLVAAGAYAATLFALARWWEEPLLRRRFEDY